MTNMYFYAPVLGEGALSITPVRPEIDIVQWTFTPHLFIYI